MKKVYISPAIEALNVEMDSLMTVVSGVTSQDIPGGGNSSENNITSADAKNFGLIDDDWYDEE